MTPIRRSIDIDQPELIIGGMECAIEFKAKQDITISDTKAFERLSEEFTPQKKIIVSLDDSKRQLSNGVLIMPWCIFLSSLWTGELVGSVH